MLKELIKEGCNKNIMARDRFADPEVFTLRLLKTLSRVCFEEYNSPIKEIYLAPSTRFDDLETIINICQALCITLHFVPELDETYVTYFKEELKGDLCSGDTDLVRCGYKKQNSFIR